MKNLRSTKYTFLTAREFKPGGWLKRQLRIEAEGLVGNLDKFWPSIRDSGWFGGVSESWERVPYWLDGFIPLAVLLEDEDMCARAVRYIDQIISHQEEDGWICPCIPEKRGEYDVWAVLLIAKVLTVYADSFGDEKRICNVLYRILQNLDKHLDKYPLFTWGEHRWFEGLIGIFWLYERYPEEWLLELAEKLHIQGKDYEKLFHGEWPYRRVYRNYNMESHVVNLAMALKWYALYGRLDVHSGRNLDAEATTMLNILREHHGMVHGHFTGDEHVSFKNASQGTELCGVVEAMYSEEWLLAASGNPVWGDNLELLAFNALPATISPDMWSHQYDQQTNQVGCVTEAKQNWLTNNVDANIFGLEPNYGCCTANMGQGWPKLALASFMRGENGIFSAVLVPGRAELEINGVHVTCELKTGYPFRKELNYTITASSAVEFDFDIRIPGFAVSAEIDGISALPGTIFRLHRTWKAGVTEIKVKLDFEVKWQARPYSLWALQWGSLIFSLPVAFASSRNEWSRDGVEHKYPYCDYEIEAKEKWNYGFAGREWRAVEIDDWSCPFHPEHPPVILEGYLAEVDWRLKEDFRGIARNAPENHLRLTEPELRHLIPYGSTVLRMTEMPMLED